MQLIVLSKFFQAELDETLHYNNNDNNNSKNIQLVKFSSLIKKKEVMRNKVRYKNNLTTKIFGCLDGATRYLLKAAQESWKRKWI